MIGVHFPSVPVITLQLTTIGLWKRVDSTIQPWCQSRTTRKTPPCAPTYSLVILGEHTTSYPRLQQRKYWSVVLASVSIIRSKPPICTARMSCAIPKTLSSQILRLPRDTPRVFDVHRRCSGGAMWSWSQQWLVYWVK